MRPITLCLLALLCCGAALSYNPADQMVERIDRLEPYQNEHEMPGWGDDATYLPIIEARVGNEGLFLCKMPLDKDFAVALLAAGEGSLLSVAQISMMASYSDNIQIGAVGGYEDEAGGFMSVLADIQITPKVGLGLRLPVAGNSGGVCPRIACGETMIFASIGGDEPAIGLDVRGFSVAYREGPWIAIPLYEIGGWKVKATLSRQNKTNMVGLDLLN